AGMDAAVAYLGEIGRTLTPNGAAAGSGSLRDDVRHAMNHIRAYEQGLSLELLRVLRDCGAHVYGIDEPARVAERVPTLWFNLPGVLPQAVTEAAARADVGIRDGHLYTPRLMRRFNLPIETGAVRVSLVHYNTLAEIHRLGNVLEDLRT